MTTARCTADAGVALTGARRGPRDRRGVALFVAAIAGLADGWHRYQAIRTLRSLDDRQLRDLGFERGQIEIVADALVATHRHRRAGSS